MNNKGRILTKNKKNSFKYWLTDFAVILFVVLVVLIVKWRKSDSEVSDLEESQTTTTTEDGEEKEEEIVGVEYPIVLEEGKLEIGSLFSFDGINPDCNNQEGENIASISLTNVSDAYLEEAQITMLLSDGSELHFSTTDLPAGKSAVVFSNENQTISEDAVCMNAETQAIFADGIVTESEKVSVEVDGIEVSLTNVSDQAISQVVVYCRSPLDEEYFGGVTYQYTINDLPAGETKMIIAEDCILGMAEVIRVAVDEKRKE